jgi:uncharacterized protein (DUF697 family)/tellurite resistance protein
MISEVEARATLRVLVAMAKADGTVHEDERAALDEAANAVELPSGIAISAVLEETIDVDAELAKIQSVDARKEAYRSAYAMANADSVCSKEEQAILDRMKDALAISAEEQSLLKRLFAETKDTVLPSHIQAVADPAKRAREIREDTLKYAVLSAVLGAFPVPGLAIATDLAVVALQVKLVRDIGQYYGHTVDKKAAGSLLTGLGVGTGARIALGNIAKLLPGWGSVVGASTSFASTWALGKVIESYFERGAKDVAGLGADFKAAQKEGKVAFKEQKAAIEAKQAEAKSELEQLNEARDAGDLSQSEYEAKVAALA